MAMDVYQAIETRKSIRRFEQKPVEQEKLTRILDAGRLAPTARCSNANRLILVEDTVLLAKIKEACMGQAMFDTAPAAIVVCSDNTRVMGCEQKCSTVDCSIAMSFMMLAATQEGLGTCWIGGFSQEPLKQALNIPEQYDVVALTPVGYPAEEGRPRNRPALEEMTYRNAWEPMV